MEEDRLVSQGLLRRTVVLEEEEEDELKGKTNV